MVNCSHCGIELKREVFCKPSHKVMFHRIHKALNSEKPSPHTTHTRKPQGSTLEKEIKSLYCKHGAIPALCKFSGCRKT